MKENGFKFEFCNFDGSDIGIAGVFEDGTTTGMVFLNTVEANGMIGSISDSASGANVLAMATLFCNRIVTFIELPEFLSRMQDAHNGDRIISIGRKYADEGVKKVRISAAHMPNTRMSSKF